MKAELQAQSLERKGEAGKLAAKVDGRTFMVYSSGVAKPASCSARCRPATSPR